MGVCSVEDCSRTTRARGLCERHYKRLRMYGDPEGGGTYHLIGMSAEDRFWHYLDKRSPDECWPWTAAKHPKGYGFILIERRSVPTHRFAYEVQNGPIPEGHQIHHTCENKACCNGRHLLALLPEEHNRIGSGFSGKNARKTHCKRGHELTPENCYDYADRRVCKLCARIRARKNRT